METVPLATGEIELKPQSQASPPLKAEAPSPSEPSAIEASLPPGYLEQVPSEGKERSNFLARGLEFFLGYVEVDDVVPKNRWEAGVEALEVTPLPSQHASLQELASRFGVPLPNLISRAVCLYCDELARESETGA